MTKSFYHYGTIPSDLMDIVEEDLTKNFDSTMQVSRTAGDIQDLQRRDSKNAWVTTNHWIGGLVWNYFNKVNDEFFHYDLDQIDNEQIQYTHYGINQKYNWHQDEGISSFYKPQSDGARNGANIVQDWINTSSNKIRKLSVIIQLSNPDDYEGGVTQLRDVDDTLYNVPKERGTIVFFDSRLYHRAKMVSGGLRKSLIAWAIGPQWR